MQRAQVALRVLGFALARLLAMTVDGHTDAMLACYEGDGAFYCSHVDGGPGDARRLALVLYLNEEWRDEDGGCLEILDPDLFEWQRVPPRIGTLAAFRAEDILHRVEPCRATARRYALTVWMLNDGLPSSAWESCD